VSCPLTKSELQGHVESVSYKMS